MLERNGGIQLEPNPLRRVRATLSVHPFREAPLNQEVALHTRVVNVEHGDPSDRFLAAGVRSVGTTPYRFHRCTSN
jgi:PIN domain nuclease of toxin-antitoxin system